MNTSQTFIDLLSRTPTVLQHLLSQIPADRREARRLEGQWSVKEWLCHLIDAQNILIDRFSRFEMEDDPLIADYEPPAQSDNRYRNRDFNEAVSQFVDLRADTVCRLESYDGTYWAKCGRHESYSPYGTMILLGHMLNVDYAHLFSMEMIGLAVAKSPG